MSIYSMSIYNMLQSRIKCGTHSDVVICIVLIANSFIKNWCVPCGLSIQCNYKTVEAVHVFLFEFLK